MTTELLEEKDILPIEDSIEVGGDLEQAVADAEQEGLLGVPLPVPGEGEPEADPEEETTLAMKIALDELYEIQDRLDKAIDDHAVKKESAGNAKKRVESLQEDLSAAVKRLRDLKKASEPDPEKYPLLDRAKAAINAAFEPAATFEEFCTRKRRETRFDTLGLTIKVTDLLKEAGFVVVSDLDKLDEANADLTTIRGISEPRAQKIVIALSELVQGWQREWEGAHPAAGE